MDNHQIYLEIIAACALGHRADYAWLTIPERINAIRALLTEASDSSKPSSTVFDLQAALDVLDQLSQAGQPAEQTK